MKAFSFLHKDGSTRIGIEYHDEFYDFSQAWTLYKDLKNKGKGPELSFLQVMVEADFFHLETFQEVIFELRKVRPIDDLKLKPPVVFLPPVGRPQKILCIGRNYKEHAEELGNKVPEEPLFFSKAPSSILAHESKISLPTNVGRVDHEGEIALVISKKASHIPEKNAFDYIAGFSLINDVTAREMQKKDTAAGRPWFRSKSFDTFCPFGPFLVPKQTINDPNDLNISVKVNGELKQQSSTLKMVFGFAEIVSYLSKFCTLEPGDIIATGTPAGVGAIKAGDTVEVSVHEIGTLINQVE